MHLTLGTFEIVISLTHLYLLATIVAASNNAIPTRVQETNRL